MSLIPEIPNPYIGAFAWGLLYGSVFCTSSCLPYIASYIAGIGAGFRKGVMVTLTFNLGRVTAYALIGGVVAAFSGALALLVSEASVSPFQQYSSYALGAVTIAIGISILLKNRKPSCDCNPETGKRLSTLKTGGRFDVGAFSLGLSRGLVLCTPLLGLLVYSVSFAAPIDSLVLAVLFGLGTTISPILLLGGVTGWLLNKAPLLRRWISTVGAGILIVLGLGTLINAIVVTSS